jgi:hypothetical protein
VNSEPTVDVLQVFFSQRDAGHNTSSLGWEQHNTGELALFLTRKPEAHLWGDAHNMFADERLHLV